MESIWVLYFTHHTTNYAQSLVCKRKNICDLVTKLKHNDLNDNQSEIHWRFAHHQINRQCFKKLSEELKHCQFSQLTQTVTIITITIKNATCREKSKIILFKQLMFQSDD